MKIGIISNSDIAIPLLYYCKNSGAAVWLYLSTAESGSKQQLQIVDFCRQAGIPVFSETTPNSLYEWMKTNQFNLVFVSGYTRKIRLSRLPELRYGIFNIHYGPLPAYRGPSPVFWQLKAAGATIGLSIHRLSDHWDAGAVVWQTTVPTEPHFNYSVVHQLFSNLALQGVAFILRTLASGGTLQEFRQETALARYQGRPALNDVLINWNTMDAAGIEALVRACHGWNNGAMTGWRGMEIKLMDVFATGDTTTEAGGTVLDDRLSVSCADGRVLQITALSINGDFVPARFASRFGLSRGQRFTPVLSVNIAKENTAVQTT